MSEKFLSVKNLHVHYVTSDADVSAVNGISLDLYKGRTLGLVGETGAGKTTVARTILGILPKPAGRITDGEVIFEGQDIYKLTEPQMQKIRGSKITMIFQDPMTALNPVMTVGDQIAEVVELHNGGDRAAARKRAVEMLETVGIPAERYVEYPHQFSGGMKQRVVIAIALACNPTLLLADEPTTALDVTIQAQVLELMKKLNSENDTSMILITHDLGVVAEMCDDVAIMYAGQIVEKGSLEDIFDHPQHPYTEGLFGALPSMKDDEDDRLKPIAGMPPDPTDLPSGCYFHPRCPYATERCGKEAPCVNEVSPGHLVQCHLRTRREA